LFLAAQHPFLAAQHPFLAAQHPFSACSFLLPHLGPQSCAHDVAEMAAAAMTAADRPAFSLPFKPGMGSLFRAYLA